MHGDLYSLLTSSLPPLGGLEDLSSAIIPLVVPQLLLPVPLMLQSWLVLVQVPGGAGHVLGDVWIDLHGGSMGNVESSRQNRMKDPCKGFELLMNPIRQLA